MVYLTVSVQTWLNKPFLRAAARLVCVFNLQSLFHFCPPRTTTHTTQQLNQHIYHTYHPRHTTQPAQSNTNGTHIRNTQGTQGLSQVVPTFHEKAMYLHLPPHERVTCILLPCRKSVALAIRGTGLDGWDWLDQNQILLAVAGQIYQVKKY